MLKKSMPFNRILLMILILVFTDLNLSYAEECRLRIPITLKGSRQAEALKVLTREEQERYILGAGIYIGTDLKEKFLYKGSLLEAVAFLRQGGYSRQAHILKSEFEKLYAKWKKQYPVLEEEISGPISFEIAENVPATCEMNVYNNTFKIDIAILTSPYLFRIEASEALDHQARALLDIRSDVDAKHKAHYKFWAFEKFCSDYEKAVIFAGDYQSLEEGDKKENLLDLQAEAIALLIERKSKYIEVIFKAISKEHRDRLVVKLENKGPVLKELREMPTYTNDADLAFRIKQYAESAYPRFLYSHIGKLGYNDIIKEIKETFAYYKTLRGRYGRNYYHGINKMKVGIDRALQGKKAFFDLLVVVVEDKSEQETKELIEEARGKYISKDQKVIVITQPTIDTIKEDMIKGNWSAVINILLGQYPEYEEYIGKGSVAILLSAGTGARNAGITQTGGGDKGKAACLNGMPYMHQVFRQAYQYWDKDLRGVLVLSNDGIAAISEPFKLGEYPISVLGSTLNLDDPALNEFGTMLVDESIERAKPIVRLVEKANYAGRRKVFGMNNNTQVPFSMAKYHFTWDAVKKIREIFSELKNAKGKFLHLKYGLDQAGESIEAVTGQTEESYIRSKVKAGWNKAEASLIWQANARLKQELGGKYAFINTGAFFIDTGDNAAYLKFGRDLTIRLEEAIDEKEIKFALTMRAARALLDLPEPDEEGRVIKVGTAYIDGKEISGSDLIKDKALMAEIESHVLLVGDYVVIGDIEHVIPAESVFINPLIYRLGPSHDRAFVFFVEEPGELSANPDVLITDIDTRNGKIRITLPVNINAKDKIGVWSIVEDGAKTNKRVFVAKSQVVGVSEGASQALLQGVKLALKSADTGHLVDSDGDVLEEVILIKETDLWNLEIWPRMKARQWSPISFQERRKGAYSFQTMSLSLDNKKMKARYSKEHYIEFVKYVKMRKALEGYIKLILNEPGSLKGKLRRFMEKIEELAPDSAMINCLNSVIKEDYFKLSDTEGIIAALVRIEAPFNYLKDSERDLINYLFDRLLRQISPNLAEIRSSL